MKKIELLMSLLALLSIGCSEIQEELEIENIVESIDEDTRQYLGDDIYITQQEFILDLRDLKNSYTGKTGYSNKTSSQCLDTNTNTDYALGIPRVGEQINFVYSSHYEPDLAYNNGPKANGESKIFHAVKRGLNTIENAIKELNKTNGQQKEHDLFTVEFTDTPLYDDHSNLSINHGPGAFAYNNYAGFDYSYDGINSIAWVDFNRNTNPLIRQVIAGNAYTVWDRNGNIIERDIILQNNEYLFWVIKSDLTSKKEGTIDCSPEIDVQAVITHFALQTLGLRPLHNGFKLPSEEDDATIFKPYGFSGAGPWLASNDFENSWHPHSWQTLTPGDKQGAWEVAPEKELVIKPDVKPVPDLDQLILHYDFDDDLANGNVPDKSGNGLNGTIVGSLDIEPGITNSAAKFDNHSYIDLDGKNFPGEKLPLNGYTIGVWLKPEQGSFSKSFSQTIFRAIDHKASVLLNYFIPFSYNTIIFPANRVQMLINNSFNTTILENQWFHYAVTFDALSGQYALYIDGVAVIEEIVPNPEGNTIIDNWDTQAFIGAGFEGGDAPFTGLMDDFVLYNYALSASDIEGLKTSGPGTVSVP